ncbi:MAG: tetratricopeptide repeat protein [Myxococcota bacterium]
MYISKPSRWLWFAIIVGTFFFSSPALYAQGAERENAEISEAQQTLNDEGVRAMIEGDFAGAVALLERSIRMGENNVTYLNLGRAYQKLGNCGEAREALEKARTAPAVKDPSEAEITSRAEEFLAELDKQCGAEEAPEDLEATPIDEPESDTVEPKDPSAESRTSSPWGWVTAGTGVAMIGAGVALHFSAESTRQQVRDETEADEDGVVRDGMSQERSYALRDQANTTDTIGLGMGIAGGVLTAVGTYLILSQPDAEQQATTLSINPGPGGVSISLGGRF